MRELLFFGSFEKGPENDEGGVCKNPPFRHPREQGGDAKMGPSDPWLKTAQKQGLWVEAQKPCF